MTISWRSVASPGQVENFPPPLMRFIRSKSSGGSRSRGRSRASSMFLRQKKSSVAAGAAVGTQEPSSPKVTCMGQVRVGRSTQPGLRPGSAGNPRSRCGWLWNAIFCCCFAGKHRTASSRRLRSPNCLSFSSCRSRREAERESRFSRNHPGFGIDSKSAAEDEGENEGENEGKSRNSFEPRVSTPPENALLLTRSRSAPYRSSSLACRFWESPPAELDDAKPKIKDEPNKEEDEETPEPKSKSFSGESDKESGITDSDTDTRFEFTCEIECAIREKDSKFEKKEGDRIEESELGFMRPPILIRCKSLPARSRELLDSEIGLWRNKIWFYD